MNYIAVRSDLGEEGLRIVFHEYAHLIISNIARNIYVAWKAGAEAGSKVAVAVELLPK